MQATLTSKGQITIPVKVRRRLNLEPGDVLDFDETAPFLKAAKKIDERAMKSVLGRGRAKLKGKTSRQWLDDLRGPAEWP